MVIPLDLRVWFNGTNANIPAGWTEDTDFSGRYLQHNKTTAGTNGGVTAHGHDDSSITHNHTTSDHNHRLILPDVSSGGIAVGSGITNPVQVSAHIHGPSFSISSKVILSAATLVMDDFNAEPPFHELILIKPDTVNEVIPDNAILLGDRDLSLDAGTGDYFLTDGNNGTPDLDARFIKTVEGGGDAGNTGGGVQHGVQNHGVLIHTHTGTHSHLDSELGNTREGPHNAGITIGKISNSYALSPHHTAVNFSTSSAGTSSGSISLSIESNLPAWSKLALFMVDNGADLREDAIFPFVGSITSIPEGWQFVDLDEGQVQCTTTIGEINDTGGANEHSHTGTSAHVGTSHNHTATAINVPMDGIALLVGGGVLVTDISHVHGSGSVTVDDSGFTVASTDIETSTDDIRHIFRTVLFIKKARVTVQINGFTRIMGGEIATL